MMQQALGIIETNSRGAITSCLDSMLKTANVEIVKHELVGGSWIAVYIVGEINAVRAAVDRANALYSSNPKVSMRGTLISNPRRELLELHNL